LADKVTVNTEYVGISEKLYDAYLNCSSDKQMNW